MGQRLSALSATPCGARISGLPLNSGVLRWNRAAPGARANRREHRSCVTLPGPGTRRASLSGCLRGGGMGKAATVYFYIAVGVGILLLVALDGPVSFGIGAAIRSLLFG